MQATNLKRPVQLMYFKHGQLYHMCDVFSCPLISTAVVASQLHAWWQRVPSTMLHCDASLTLAQQSDSDGVFSKAAVVARSHDICYPATS